MNRGKQQHLFQSEVIHIALIVRKRKGKWKGEQEGGKDKYLLNGRAAAVNKLMYSHEYSKNCKVIYVYMMQYWNRNAMVCGRIVKGGRGCTLAIHHR